jgi:pectin methylesterase-like acyl-CoA thioesterase
MNPTLHPRDRKRARLLTQSAFTVAIAALSSAAFSQVVLTVNPAESQSGSNYTTIQAAINAVPFNSLTPYDIQISPGTYHESDTISSSQQYITLQGMGATPGAVTITGGAGAVQMTAAGNDLTFENLTFSNTGGPSAGQQNTLYIQGDKQIYDNVAIDAYQDTLQAENTGRFYVVNSTIQGTVDFIYGSATGFFTNDTITQLSTGGTGFTAPSTPQSSNYGFVFYNDTLNSLSSGSTTLARSWNSAFGMSAFVDDTLASNNIAGWGSFGAGTTYTTERLTTYGLVNSSDSPINTSASSWSSTAIWPYQLTATQAAPYMSATTVLSGWNPTQPLVPIIWQGGNGAWETAADWSSSAIPASGQGIYIEPATSAAVTLSSTASVDTLDVGVPAAGGANTGGTPSTLTIGSGGTLNVTGLLHLDGGSALILNGEALSVPRIDSGNQNDQVTIENGSSLDVASWTNSNGAWPSGTITVHTGSLHLGSTGLGPIVILAPNSTDSATYNIEATDSDDLRVIDSGSGTSVVNMSGTPSSPEMDSTYGLQLGTNGAGGKFTFNMSSGTFVGINFYIGAAAGTYTGNQSGGTVEQYGNSFAGQEEFELAQATNAVSTWNLTGSTAAMNFGCMAVGESGTALFNQTAGTVTLDSITYSGESALTNLGLRLAQSGSGTGTYKISGGSLLVDQGGLTLGYTWAGASSGGTGNFQVVGGDSSIDITGNYQENTRSILTAEINSTGLSTIDVTGNVSFASGSLLDIIQDNSLTLGSKFILMSWNGIETGTPTLSTTDANNWTFSLANNELTLTYVPEPASMGLLAFGLLTLAAPRRGASI